MLCLIGCITLPADAFEHAYVGDKASADEQKMYRAHPDIGFQLLSRIPRLESVAEMIRLQQVETSNWAKSDVAERGSRMLKTAQELDRRTLRGTPFQTACDQLRAASAKISHHAAGRAEGLLAVARSFRGEAPGVPTVDCRE